MAPGRCKGTARVVGAQQAHGVFVHRRVEGTVLAEPQGMFGIRAGEDGLAQGDFEAVPPRPGPRGLRFRPPCTALGPDGGRRGRSGVGWRNSWRYWVIRNMVRAQKRNPVFFRIRVL